MRVLLKNAVLLDALHDYEKRDILTEDGRIRAVAPSIEAAADEIVDMTGCTVMPGIINCHVHMTMRRFDGDDAPLKSFAMAGVTAIRDMGYSCAEPYDDFLDWVRRDRGPAYTQVFAVGKFVAYPGGYGWSAPGSDARSGMDAGSVEKALETVREQLERGVNAIKIGVGNPPGWRGPEDSPSMPPEIVSAICAEVRKRGGRISAHVEKAKYLEMLVDNGITESAHIVGDEVPNRLIRKMLDKNVLLCATLGMYEDKALTRGESEAWEHARSNVGRMFRAGVPISVGTDYMPIPERREKAAMPIYELRVLRQAGLGIRDVIVAGTLHSAMACGAQDRMGLLTENREANIIAVASPLDDSFDAMTHVEFVMNRGTIIKNEL